MYLNNITVLVQVVLVDSHEYLYLFMYMYILVHVQYIYLLHFLHVPIKMADCFIIIYNSLGEPVYDESGELVCTKPFPSMPTHFWNDEDGIKYHKAYFTMFQG